MPESLLSTNRCELMKNLSGEIWDDIISFHQAGENSSEIYYTKKIVKTIINSANNLNFSIWATEPGNEKLWGSDIDIYIERNTNNFELYAFQAKLLKLGNRYEDLNRNSLGTYQWEKLKSYKEIKGCHINYLFYNGVLNFLYNSTDRCGNYYNQKQLGLSYVSVNDVERITLSKSSWFFYDFHTNYSHPLSEIVCCRGEFNPEIKIYNFAEIKETLNEYKRIIFAEDIENYYSKLENNSEIKDKNIDKLIRKPDVIVVIRNTTSTY